MIKNKINTLDKYFKITFFINAAAIIIGLFQFTTLLIYVIIMDYLLIIAWFMNFFLIYITFHYINANNKEAHKIYAYCWLYLLQLLIIIVLMVVNSLILSGGNPTEEVFPVFQLIIIPIAIFSTNFFASYICWINMKTINKKGYWKFEQEKDH